MSGHSHWAGIKHKKGITDQKKGKIFAKLLSAISAAARSEPNPDFNPRLRTAVQKAKDVSVPNDKIASAIKRASEVGQKLEELIFEAYGPGGTAILIEAVSDNKNRAISDIKKIISDFGGKWAETGSVRWAFKELPREESAGWEAMFFIDITEEDMTKLKVLIEALNDHDDVQNIYANVDMPDDTHDKFGR
ncbi:MAG: YebC/PmpR family DNA-binding transcriptional regulator [Patescibacteria group bacterium]